MPSTDPDEQPVGPPHRGDADGCLADCPHTSHTGAPVIVAISPELQPLMADWLEALGLTMEYVPTPPAVPEPHYGVVIRPGTPAAALLTPSPVDGQIRPPRYPRDRSTSRHRLDQR